MHGLLEVTMIQALLACQPQTGLVLQQVGNALDQAYWYIALEQRIYVLRGHLKATCDNARRRERV